MTVDETQRILLALAGFEGRTKARLDELDRKVGEHTEQLDGLLTAAAKVEAVAEYRRNHRARIAGAIGLLISATSALTVVAGYFVRNHIG